MAEDFECVESAAVSDEETLAMLCDTAMQVPLLSIMSHLSYRIHAAVTSIMSHLSCHMSDTAMQLSLLSSTL
jgi:hypothetical protein